MTGPTHIACILDGNRRYAKKIGFQPWKGHDFGAKKLKEVLNWLKELEIRTTTLYSFSIENFNRTETEFNHLMNLFRKEFKDMKSSKEIHKNKIKIRAIGRLHLFPEDIQESLKELMETTKNYKNYNLNLALAYGGRSEITDTAKKLAQKIKNKEIEPEDIDEKMFQENLYMSEEPDIIIRTGGDRRTSNFLNYQAAYSEWFFLDKYWPEITKEDFIEVIKQFKNRERRFGR